MNITDIRIRLTKKDNAKLKAVASIVIDEEFVVHDIKVIEGERGYFIAMPSRKTPEGDFKDIAHPLTSETRTRISNMILEEFEKVLANAPAPDEVVTPHPTD